MSSDELVLKVSGVSKYFEVYDNPSLRLKQLLVGRRRKYYREFWALRDVSLEVRRGECIGIIGRNGAGKSTLLQIITGILPPSSGTVRTEGRIAALLELGSGFNPEYTGRENVYMNASILGLRKEEIDARFADIAAFADIGDFIEQPVKTYSSGMMLRLAFAVQVMVDPDILIVDEALAVGDALFQQKCIQCLRGKIARGMTIFFVSHDLSMVKAFCTRVIYIKEGRIERQGAADEVVNYFWNELNLSSATVPVAKSTIADGDRPAVSQAQGADLFRVDPAVVHHGGGGEVKFTAFDFYNAEGERVTRCEMYDKIRLVVSCHAEKTIPAGSRFGFVCNDIHGIDLIVANMYVYDSFLPEIRAGTDFTLSAEFSFPLVPGCYFFSYSLRRDYESVYYYDIMHKVHSLEVDPPNWMKKRIGGRIHLKDIVFSCDGIPSVRTPPKGE